MGRGGGGGCKGEGYQVGDGSTTSAHGTEGCMTRSVQEGQRLLAIRHLHLKGANMLHSTHTCKYHDVFNVPAQYANKVCKCNLCRCNAPHQLTICFMQQPLQASQVPYPASAQTPARLHLLHRSNFWDTSCAWAVRGRKVGREGGGGGGTWVMPPASPAATDVLRSASNRDVCTTQGTLQVQQQTSHNSSDMLSNQAASHMQRNVNSWCTLTHSC